MVDWTFNDKKVFGSSFKSYIQTVFSCHGFFLRPFHNANCNDLEMKLKYLMLVLFSDGQIEIKWTIAMFIPEHKQKRLHEKEICHLIRTVIENKPIVKEFRFARTNKSITTCIEKKY